MKRLIFLVIFIIFFMSLVFAAPIKNVERTEFTISSGTTTSKTLVNTLTNTSQSFLFCSYSADVVEPGLGSIRYTLTNATAITVNRGTSSTATTSIVCYVTEYLSGVSVQRGSATTPATATITEVNLSNSVVLISWEGLPSTYGADDFYKANLTNSTTIRFCRNGGGAACANPTQGTVSWQVVEFQGAVVQRGEANIGSTASSFGVNINQVNLSRSLLLPSYDAEDGTATNIGQKMLDGEFVNSSLLNFSRMNTGVAINVAWQVIEFPDNVTVQSGLAVFNTTDTLNSTGFSTAINRNTSLAISGGGFNPYMGGKNSYAGNDNPGPGHALINLTSSTTLELKRNVTGSTPFNITWFVVDFNDSVQGDVDGDYPNFYNISDNGLNATQTGTGQGNFSININNTNGTVGFEFNAVNYTPFNSTGAGNYWNISIPSIGAGTYPYYFWAKGNGSNGNHNSSEVRHFTVNASADNVYPIFFDFVSNPANNTVYSSGAIYRFNVSINSTNATAGIEFNGVNYSAQNISNIFNSSVSDLAAGTYPFYWWAYGNGTLRNYNNTVTMHYTVSKAVHNVTLSLNSSGVNLSVDYPSQVNASGRSATGTVNLTRNGIDINSLNHVFQSLAAGQYNYTALVIENQNYTNNSATLTATINRAILQGSISGTSPITYGTAGNVQGSESNTGDADAVYLLTRENSSVSNPDTTVLGVGSYVYVWNATGGQNWTTNASMGIFVLTVNQAGGNVTLFINGSRSDFTVTENQSVWLNGSLVLGQFGSLNLSRNNSQINYSTSSNLTNFFNFTGMIGNWTFRTNYSGNANYTGFQEAWNVHVLGATTDNTRPSVTSLTENPADPATYSVGQRYEFNATITDDNLQTVIFSFNGVNYSASQNGNVFNKSLLDLAAGTYSYYWFANDSSGNVNQSSSGTYTINKAQGQGTLLLNGSANNITITYPSQINASATNTTGKGNLTRDSTDINSLNHVFENLAVGYYNFTMFILETQNYSNRTITFFANITKGTPTGTISLSPSSTVTYPTQTTASGSESNMGDTDVVYILSRNNTARSNPEITTFGVGSFIYTYNSTGGQNWTASSSLDSETLVVNKNDSLVYTYINHTRGDVSYSNGTSVMFNSSLISGVLGSLNLTIDSTQLNFSTTLGNLSYTHLFNAAGTFVINTSYSGNENYSAISEAWIATITLPSSPSNTTSVSTPLCRYKKFGYYNPNLPWFRQVNCL